MAILERKDIGRMTETTNIIDELALYDEVMLNAIFDFLRSNPEKLLQIEDVRSTLSKNRTGRISKDNLKRFEGGGDNAVVGTLDHNVSNLKKLAGFDRGVDLVMPLLRYPDLVDIWPDARILCLGPRNENELFALLGFGVKPHHLSALDLITYSPLVTLGNMHDMPFEDNQFDVVIAGWVLAYSNNLQKAVSEIARVTRNGGLVSLGWDFSASDSPYAISGRERGLYLSGNTNYECGSSESIAALFGNLVGHVVYSANATRPYGNFSRRNCLIFQLEKNKRQLASDRESRREECLAQTILEVVISQYESISKDPGLVFSDLISSHYRERPLKANDPSSLSFWASELASLFIHAFSKQLVNLFPPRLNAWLEDIQMKLASEIIFEFDVTLVEKASDSQSLLTIPGIQRLVFHPVILARVEESLGVFPVFDSIEVVTPNSFKSMGRMPGIQVAVNLETLELRFGRPNDIFHDSEESKRFLLMTYSVSLLGSDSPFLSMDSLEHWNHQLRNLFPRLFSRFR